MYTPLGYTILCDHIFEYIYMCIHMINLNIYIYIHVYTQLGCTILCDHISECIYIRTHMINLNIYIYTYAHTIRMHNSVRPDI